MGMTYYNNIPLANGINDSIASLTTTKSGTYIDNKLNAIEEKLAERGSGFNGLYSTNLTVDITTPPSGNLATAITNYVILTKEEDPSAGDTVIITRTSDNSIYGGVTYNGTSWLWGYVVKSGNLTYDDLTNKPQINSVELTGDKSSRDLQILYRCTQAQYDAITTKNDNTLYLIID